MVRPDPHSYADDNQPAAQRMNLQLSVDFLRREVRGEVVLYLDRPATGTLDLDTRDLHIDAVTTLEGAPIQFELGTSDPVLGQRLRVFLEGAAVRVRYRTGARATALQWLAPEQTASGREPFVFTQCQAIHARSVVPCQDTPRIRVRYTADIDVPPGLTAVMAAAPVGHDTVDGRSVFRFEMPQPIPPYLLAFAVGELASAELGPRSRVYAEPSVVDAAAWEFQPVDEHLRRAEALFGPYDWDRFDLLVMPPSFPYGGMENPRLTFVTPSLLAGDRSLVSVIAHELAHSWTGNLVTNANMNHFWLNEGFTVYAERRIVEAVYGAATRDLQAAVGRAHLEADMVRLKAVDPALTRLRTELSGHDPDDVFSVVPYEKGYLFLLRIEQNVGRPRFDAFLRRYIERFRFTSIETSHLLTFMRSDFPDLLDGIDVDAWIDGSDLPADAPRPESARRDEIVGWARAWSERQRPSIESLRTLDADEWQVFLSRLPTRLDAEDVEWFEAAFSLSTSRNAELRVGWLAAAARSDYQPLFDAVETTLLTCGRMKYLRPLYEGLVAAGPEGRTRAETIYRNARDKYHPVAQQLVEGLLK